MADVHVRCCDGVAKRARTTCRTAPPAAGVCAVDGDARLQDSRNLHPVHGLGAAHSQGVRRCPPGYFQSASLLSDNPHTNTGTNTATIFGAAAAPHAAAWTGGLSNSGVM